MELTLNRVSDWERKPNFSLMHEMVHKPKPASSGSVRGVTLVARNLGRSSKWAINSCCCLCPSLRAAQSWKSIKTQNQPMKAKLSWYIFHDTFSLLSWWDSGPSPQMCISFHSGITLDHYRDIRGFGSEDLDGLMKCDLIDHNGSTLARVWLISWFCKDCGFSISLVMQSIKITCSISYIY